MNSRISRVAAAAIVAASVAGYLAAQGFEESVIGALRPDGALNVDMSTIRQNIAGDAGARRGVERLAPQEDLMRGGGAHGGGTHPEPRVHHAPPPRRAPHPVPRTHPVPRQDHRPRIHPPRDPGSRIHPRPTDGHHRNWGRWHGHPGWGHRHERWIWIDERPHWWGWLVWSGESAEECVDYYQAQLGGCGASCGEERADCIASCGPFPGPECAGQCELSAGYCSGACEDDYERRVDASCAVLD